MIEIYQIIIILFAAFALTRVFLQRKSKNFSFNEFLFWSGIWLALILVSFSNPLLVFIADFLGLSRGVDLLIYGSITILLYLVYRLYAKIDKQQQEITELVTWIAVQNPKKKR